VCAVARAAADAASSRSSAVERLVPLAAVERLVLAAVERLVPFAAPQHRLPLSSWLALRGQMLPLIPEGKTPFAKSVLI
jgi:hypothetical protein